MMRRSFNILLNNMKETLYLKSYILPAEFRNDSYMLFDEGDAIK